MQYIFSEDERIVHTSVREICEFLFREGHVYSGGVDITEKAMQRGAEIHREIQHKKKKENKNYKSEVRIECTEEIDGFEYEISGVMDGIIENGDATVIDEFKTTAKDIDDIEWDSVKAYSAQLMCYGYMYAIKHSLNFITLHLTYYNYNTERSRELEKEFTITELCRFFEEILKEHVKWAKVICEHKLSRDRTLRVVSFPFPKFRKGQRELSAKVYRCIRDCKRLFAEAPTGIGKTVSTLFPALKSLGEGDGKKVFYLAAKNMGSLAAENALTLFRENGADVNFITLTSKEKICPKDRNCLPGECEYSNEHYSRVNAALFEIITEHPVITKDIILACAEKHKVCPFELELDVSEFCDVIIGDYNYGFDPRAKLARYFKVENGDYTVLVDEAHNLVDRARDMFTADISLKFLQSFRGVFKNFKRLNNSLTRCINAVKKIRNSLILQDKTEAKIPFFTADYDPFFQFCEYYRQFLSDDGNDEIKKSTLELYFQMRFFCEMSICADEMADCYVTLCVLEDEDATVRFFCADPSEHIKQVCSAMRSCIFFSATMTPYEYYIKMLEADSEEDELISIPSPFPKENLLCCIYRNFSARLKDRADGMGTVLDIIDCATGQKAGNYLVFFPSYSYMTEAYEEFTDCYKDVKTVIQKPSMTKEERDEFLGNFTKNPTETLIGFALCGGVFSEGIDLVGDRLSGAIIIGTGLPSICFERDVLKSHFDLTIGEGLGYNYAYTYTGLNRVFQAGGRVIRTKDDRGFIVLADDRYTLFSHRRTFPSSWKDAKVILSPNALGQVIKQFWDEKN